MNDKYDPIKSKSNYKEQTSFQVKENKNNNQQRETFSTNSNKGVKKSGINKTKILIINIITIAIILVIIFGNGVLTNINLSGENKYELENGDYQLTFRNNWAVVGEDTIPAGTYKVTGKDIEEDRVVFKNEYSDDEREFDYVADPKERSILKDNYSYRYSYFLDEDTSMSGYVRLEEGEYISIDKTYSSRSSEILFEKVDEIPKLNTISDSTIGEYTTDKPTIDIEFKKDKYSNEYEIRNRVQIITIKNDKVIEYNIDYSEMEKTEYTYDSETESLERNKNEYYDVNDIIDKNSKTIALDLLDDTYIFVN